jgi:hypothetical protein
VWLVHFQGVNIMVAVDRRRFLSGSGLLAAGAASCRRSGKKLDVFPTAAAGGWTRVALRDLPVAASPDPVPRRAVRRAQEAAYQGPGRLNARAYLLTSPAIALDLIQRWRPSADTVFFSRGSVFVVVNWRQAERKALQAFIRDVESRLPQSP